MLLTDRRRGLIFACLAGMEMAWFTPFLVMVLSIPTLWRGTATAPVVTPLVVFATLWISLLLLMVTIEFLDQRQVDSPRYEIILVALVIVTAVVAVRVVLYTTAPLTDFRWLGNTGQAVFNFHRGLRPELVLVGVALFLWWRATYATSREISFFSVGFSFRLGLLLLFVGGGILAARPGGTLSALGCLWAFLSLGLIAVAVTRIEDRAASAHDSRGAMLPLGRLLQVVVLIGLTVGSTALLARVYTPHQFLQVLRWTAPFWRLLGQVVTAIVEFVFMLLNPLFIWLEDLLRRLANNPQLARNLEDILRNLRAPNVSNEPLPSAAGIPVPAWVWSALRYGFVLLVIALVIGFILLFVGRLRARRAAEEHEQAGGEKITFGGSAAQRGWRRLRNLARLIQRYGVGSQLLAAISVQNIYANVSRLARRHGFARRPAQPPDEYLAVLTQAFPGQELALQRLTAAYMRVHYGDRPISDEELGQLRADYRVLQDTIASTIQPRPA